MEIAKLTSKGQITIPKAVREELGVDTGDKLLFVKCEQGYIVMNGDNFGSLPSGAAVKAKAPAAEPDAAQFDELPVSPLYDGEKKDKDKKKKKKKKK